MNQTERSAIGPLAHELRRLCPFVPALAAIARRDVRLGPDGPTLHRGERLVLDVYGTDHLPSRYPRPGVLDPDRFREHAPGLFDLVPQGGGDPAHGHRCPGEPVTVLLLADAVRTLADLEADLDGPAGYGLRTMPTRPRNGPRLRVRRPLGQATADPHPGPYPDPHLDTEAPTGVAVTTLPEETVPPPQPDPRHDHRTDPHVDRHPDPRRGGAPDDATVLDAVAADHRRVLEALDRLQRDPAPTDPLAPALWLLAVHDALHHELFPLVTGDEGARRAVEASLAECALLQQQTEQLQTVSPADGVDLVQAGLLAETAESHFRAQTDVELPALLPHLDAAGRTVLVEAFHKVPPPTTGSERYGELSASARARIRATWVRPAPTDGVLLTAGVHTTWKAPGSLSPQV
ncbi:hypothetical protein [Lapillicoccus jejuensis]|uniref:Cytochrome P450 n=1 Tax=Lapillicoccus jejuensis TaxID=402171 RepID=A0A542E5T5_9MICO|nr:hypothetical protein [Lapillicoccus jejuensis]TQJ10705.1 hypothetical protein FB458_3839 [Lapillicoccus jejuensis]